MNDVSLRSARVATAPFRTSVPPATASVWDRIWTQRGPVSKLIATAREGMHALHRAVLLPHLTPDSRLLELGCGPSTLTLSVAHRIRELVGLDISEEALRQARANQHRFGVANATFVNADCRAVPFQDAFDVVWSAGLIEHFFERDIEVVRQHLQAVKPGGLVFLSVPYRYSLHRLHYLLSRPAPLRWLWPWSDVRNFQRFYSLGELRALGARTGLPARVFYLPPFCLGFLLGILLLEVRKPRSADSTGLTERTS